MSARHHFLRLDERMHDDARLMRVASKLGPTTWAYWVALLALTKRERDLGQVTVTGMQLARTILDPDIDAGERMLEAFADAGLIELELQPDGAARVTVEAWGEWQTMTDAERAKKSYHARKAFTPDAQREPHGRRETSHETRENVTQSRRILHRPETIDQEEGRKKSVREQAGEGAGVTFAERWAPALDALEPLHGGDIGKRSGLEYQLHTHAYRFKLPPEAYERAAVALAQKIEGGWRPRQGGANAVVAYYLSTVRSFEHVIELAEPETTDQETETNAATRRNPHAGERARHARFAAFD